MGRGGGGGRLQKLNHGRHRITNPNLKAAQILLKKYKKNKEKSERELDSNSKTLFYKDCSLGSVKNLSNN